jgi:hypothetical protein
VVDALSVEVHGDEVEVLDKLGKDDDLDAVLGEVDIEQLSAWSASSSPCSSSMGGSP